MPTHEYANIPQTRRRVYLVATLNLEFSQRFSFPDPIPLTVKATDWIDRKVQQPSVYYFEGNSPFEEKIRKSVVSQEYIYRAFHGSISAMHNRKCPTLTASMYKPQNAIMVRDDFGVRRLTLRECLRFQGFPAQYYFPKSITLDDAYKQIGNSVSVPVIHRIAQSIMTALVNCE
jgi:DNA (cytosine-5)-methyltransferase 1